MKAEYDFSNGEKNPYVKSEKISITIRLDRETVDWFKRIAREINLPYQTLVNFYLTDCAKKDLRPCISWQERTG